MKARLSFPLLQWLEPAPPLWRFTADLLALLAALAVAAAWVGLFGSSPITMDWVATGVRRPGLLRAYRLRLPALWS